MIRYRARVYDHVSGAHLPENVDEGLAVRGRIHQAATGKAHVAVPRQRTGQYGTGDAEGTSYDTDWVHPSDQSLLLKTESDTEADTDWYSIDVGWWLSFGGSRPERGVELFAGYLKDRAHFVETNFRVIEDPYDIADIDSYEGPVATWDLDVSAARLGARSEFPLANKLSLGAEVAVLVGRAEGEGNWKLREYLFQQKGDGTGVDALLMLIYSPIENLSIHAGGRYYAFEGKDGTDSGVEGEEEYHNEGLLDEITVEQLGWFLGVSYSF